MINMGCIDINPWNSRITDPLHPDYIVIDLDPNEKHRSVNGLKRLVSAAMAAKSYFDENELKAFAKTSGKTGMHFLVPCSGFNYSEARNFAEHICEGIHKMVPDISTINNSISKRGERIYIDPSQNDYADTIAAPYSARPYILPTVSTPLEWKEINAKLDPDVFTIKTISGRLQKKGDLFAAISDKKIISKNNKILKTLF
jgi:bifunctional non-homologous end joining protein LigD